MKKPLFVFTKELILVLLTVLLTASCVSKKKLVYFQGADNVYTEAQKINQMYEMKLKPADQILVKITCQTEPELLSIFARDVTMGLLGNQTNYNQTGSLSNSYAYTVTNDGVVILPAIGRVYVNNLTCDDAATAIERRIKELKLILDPEVTVRLQNARVTVVGAVKTPKTVNLTSERNTVIDILAQCGDLDVTSLRKNVKLFRETNGERHMYTLDLTDVNIFNSPAFYVQQNDMIYVEPNKSLGVKSSAFYTVLSAGASILGLASSIVALAFAIKDEAGSK